MSLSLPEDMEPFLAQDYQQYSNPAVYALTLTVPDDVRQQWREYYDHTPDYLEAVENASTVIYVGAAKNAIARLEDHVDGDVRRVALLRFCEIDSLRNVWWYDSAERAFERESGLAIELNNHTDASTYVHQR